ncbi:MAG TPA: type II toxin-antitoxin system PemK/MazF family toxin [Campylobacterales bacterium]|nr:type II toxin-antitoxin system PemK/MazF family toxin [Campylobacterales bacterium]
MRRGDIYLVDYGKSRNSFEFGKTRPVVIFQTDKLNYAVEEEIYNFFLVIPISTMEDIVTDEFRVKIKARGKLEKDGFAVCNSVCFIHKKYIYEKLAILTDSEIEQIERKFRDVFDM